MSQVLLDTMELAIEFKEYTTQMWVLQFKSTHLNHKNIINKNSPESIQKARRIFTGGT